MNRRARQLLASIATSVLALHQMGCDTETKDSPRTRAAAHALTPIASCQAAQEALRQVAIDEMNARIDAAIASYEQWGCPQYRCGFHNECFDSISEPDPSGPSSTTGTNNQVENVDEADFVKNDGRYIYLAQSRTFRIIDGWPADQTHIVSETALEGTPKKLFVLDDRVLLYLSINANNDANPWANTATRFTRFGGSSGECTYGYDCDFAGDGTATKIVVFDVQDRANPRRIRELTISSALIAARRIGDTVHTVLAENLDLFAGLSYAPDGILCDFDDEGSESTAPPEWAAILARAQYEALRETNLAIIQGADMSAALPTLVDSLNPAGANVPEALCEQLYQSPLRNGISFLSMVSLNMTHEDPAHAVAVLSRPGAVYASGEALYVAVRTNSEEVALPQPQPQPQQSQLQSALTEARPSPEELSAIHKFRISASAGDSDYVGSGLVRGHVLNQFSMDEYGGDLRIATTSGWAPSPNAITQVTVLREENGALDQIGFVGGMAPSEDIRSVRFSGNRGFIVTFKKTDPLFVLDLADPSTPTILSELKIPGFSTYMHMLDDTHILSIGYDTDDHDTFAYFDGVLIQVFDISDPMAPTLQHRHVVGTRGSSSEALTNHLAFTFYPERNVLTLPMTVCEGGDDGRYGDVLTFSGLMVFDVDLASGISERGRVEHQGQGADSLSCSTWWTNANSVVKRSFFFDDYVYSVSDADLRVQDIRDLGHDLAHLSF
ncbi:MAG: beta-propeller domain-containing protein [Deltaproteobacteria bacterium]|nr:beta-propeller domain-containing protein [Deltaproteobacteria bacterium]